MDSPFLLNHAYSFFYGLAAFLIFTFLIAKFGMKPIVQAIDARDARIKKQLLDAEAGAAKAQQLQADLAKELAGAEAKIGELMAEARRDAEALKASIVADGHREVTAQKNRALRDIDAAKHAALVELRTSIAEIATDAAQRIIKAELDPLRQTRLVEDAIESYEASVAGA